MPDLHFLKRLGDMTAFTQAAKTSTMRIVPRMTAVTSCGHLNFFVYRFLVASYAGQPFVRPVQLEFGLHIVIEPPQVPSIRIVAGFTCWPEPPLVRIFILMTAVAF